MLHAVMACAILAFGPVVAHAGPFTMADLLQTERFGHVALSPRREVLAFEKVRPLSEARIAEYDALDPLLRTEVFLASVGEPPRRLTSAQEGGGAIGSWSPDGRWLLIYRLRDRKLEAGLVDAGAGQVRWLPGMAESALWGRSGQWRTSDELLLLMRSDDDAPPVTRMGWLPLARLEAQWSQTRAGRSPARTIIGSGRFADTSPRSPEGRLVRVNALTGAMEAVATGRFLDLELSPDGRYAALVSAGDRKPVQPDRPFLAGEIAERRGLTIVDLEAGSTWSPATAGDVSPHLMAWSPHGDRLLVWARDADDLNKGRLLAFEPGSKDERSFPSGNWPPAILETGLRTQVIAADWLGDNPVLHVQTSPERRDWAVFAEGGWRILTSELDSPGARLLAVGSEQIVVRAGGDAWRIRSHEPPMRLGGATSVSQAPLSGVLSLGQRFQFSTPSRQDWLMISDRSGRQRVRISDGEPIGPVSSSAGAIADLTATEAVLKIKSDTGRQLLEWNGQPLARLNQHFDAIDFARPSAVHHVDGDGQALTSFLYRPRSRVSSIPPPLVILPYPGGLATPSTPGDDPVMTNAQLMVGAGYAVLVPSLPRVGHRGEPAADMARDILAVVQAAEAIGGFDPGRLILWGHSFGAYPSLPPSGSRAKA